MGYDMYREGRRYDDDGDDYYRLNIWGMSTVREELVAAGVVATCDWPRPIQRADFGGETAEFSAAIEQLRDGTPEDCEGIPFYKLSSNDGWLVNSTEIAAGLARADRLNPRWRDQVEAHTRDFARWMEESPDGFRIY